MSLKTQGKVLRAIEEQRFEPVGGAGSVQVDVRVIAATNKNMEEEIDRFVRAVNADAILPEDF